MRSNACLFLALFHRTGDRRRAIRSGLQELRASSAVLDPDLLLALAFYFASQVSTIQGHVAWWRE